MVDVQCGATSTTITLPASQMLDPGYAYNKNVQTFEANIEQGDTIYFEFEPFVSSSEACPIIMYKVKDVVVTETNHAIGTPNYIYGRDSSDNFVYEAPKT